MTPASDLLTSLGLDAPASSLLASLFALDTLYSQRAALAAPYTAQIHALEYDRALATAPLDAQIAALEATCKPLVLAQGHSVHAGTLSAVYQRRTYWDGKGLEGYAKEQPSILQFQEVRPIVTFRHAAHTPSIKETL